MSVVLGSDSYLTKGWAPDLKVDFEGHGSVLDSDAFDTVAIGIAKLANPEIKLRDNTGKFTLIPASERKIEGERCMALAFEEILFRMGRNNDVSYDEWKDTTKNIILELYKGFCNDRTTL